MRSLKQWEAIALAAVVGCSRAPSGTLPAVPSSPAAANEVRSNGDAYVIRFTPTPDPIPLGQLFSLDVSVLDARTVPLPGKDVTLAVDARMPEHQHGMNVEPRVTPRGDGRFTVTGMEFHMAGRWEITFDVTRAGLTERAQVEKVLE
ncbi:MAG: FixH family protein [Planctomycetes bacterium]|nr:FixH family protein [Planctomycetota bacterium]MBI3844048.1 FixH family protein [Planctomycetota bacterium]